MARHRPPEGSELLEYEARWATFRTPAGRVLRVARDPERLPEVERAIEARRRLTEQAERQSTERGTFFPVSGGAAGPALGAERAVVEFSALPRPPPQRAPETDEQERAFMLEVMAPAERAYIETAERGIVAAGGSRLDARLIRFLLARYRLQEFSSRERDEAARRIEVGGGQMPTEEQTLGVLQEMRAQATRSEVARERAAALRERRRPQPLPREARGPNEAELQEAATLHERVYGPFGPTFSPETGRRLPGAPTAPRTRPASPADEEARRRAMEQAVNLAFHAPKVQAQQQELPGEAHIQALRALGYTVVAPSGTRLLPDPAVVPQPQAPPFVGFVPGWPQEGR